MQDMIDGTYRIIREIGRGGAGIVYLAYHLRLEKYVVLKNARIKANDMALLRNEADILKGLHHPSLPQVYDFLQMGDEIYTVIDFVDGDNLEHLVESGVHFTEEQLIDYLMTLTEVLIYIHGHNPPVLHSDIKPANIMLRQDGSLCLIDFNISVGMMDEISVRGLTWDYASPEQCTVANDVIHYGSSQRQLDGRSDIYALGATFYYLMTGIIPCHQTGELIPLKLLATDYSADLIKIVEKMMKIDPEQRYPDAVSLKNAVERILHRGKRFRNYCLLQALTVLVSGGLVCAGICCLLHGRQLERHSQFLQEYNQIVSASYLGDSDTVIRKGIDVLNDYSTEREKSPELWFELLNAVAGNLAQAAQETQMGNTAEAYSKDAIAYYQAACEYAAQQHLEQLDDCFLEYCAFLCRQKSTSLSDVISEASALGVSEDNQRIAEAMELCLTDSSAAALEQLSEIAEGGQAAYTAYLAMADLYFQEEQLEQAAESYEQALTLNTETAVQRRLAEVYMDLGQENQDSDYYQRAEKIYEELSTGTGRMQDRLSFMVAAGCAGDFVPAAEEMERLLLEYPEDYYVLGQTAVLYYKMGNLISAKQYGEQAIRYADDVQKGSELYEALEQLVAMGGDGP